jgi:hypothetical protein
MMIARAGIAAALLVGTLAAHLPAQQRTDFSGRWTTAPAATAGGGAVTTTGGGGGGGGAGGGPGGRTRAGDMGSGWGPTITIRQDATRVTVEYTFFARGDMQPPLRFHYALDGSETKNTVMMGRGIQEQLSTTSWTDNKLVITTRHRFTNPENGQPTTSEVKRVLSLASPDSLSVETTRSGVLGGPPSTTLTIYRKMP